MSELKEKIKEIMNDLLTNEVAIIDSSKPNDNKLLFYAKVELEGDAFQVINSHSKEIIELHNALIKAAAKNRQAVWNFIQKALL